MISGMMLYYDALEEYGELTDEQFGRLIRAGLVYGRDDVETQLPVPEKYLYPGLKLKIARDKEKYLSVCEKRAEAARKRWDKQQTGEQDEMQLDANGCKQCQEKEKYQSQEKEKEKKKYQYQEKEKEKARPRSSAHYDGERDYSGEDEEARQRMIEQMLSEKEAGKL